MRIIGGLVVATLSLTWLLATRYLLRDGWRIWPILVIVPALVFSLNELRWHRFESMLASATEPVLADRDAGFGCERLMRNFWSSQGRVGHVWFDADGSPADEAFLSRDTCDRVKSWRDDPADASLEEIVAVHTVVHEAAHLAGERNEALAECIAIAHDAQIMERLGATPEEAGWAVARYVELVYPRLPAPYHGDCLDHPMDAVRKHLP